MATTSKTDPPALLEKRSKWSVHFWTGHDLVWHLRKILKPIIYLTIANIVVTALGSHASTALLVETAFLPLLFLAELITYGWVAGHIVVQSVSQLGNAGMRWSAATLSSALTGLGVGIVMTFFRIFWFRDVWTFYNIITEPGLRFVEGVIVGGIVAAATILILKLRK